MNNYGDLGGCYPHCLNDQYNPLAGFELVRFLPPQSFTRCCDNRISCISSYIDLLTDLWSTLFVFNSVVAIYKCLGHTYDVGSVSVYSYYLVIENNQTIPRTGDIVVSTSSDGFIETVVAAHHNTSTDAFYLETKLQRCHENSRWNSTGYEFVCFMSFQFRYL